MVEIKKLARAIVDELLADRDQWCEVGDGMYGPVADMDWSNMVSNVQHTLEDKLVPRS